MLLVNKCTTQQGLYLLYTFLISCGICPFQVQYQSDQFLDKNKDYVIAEHQDLLGASKCPFVVGLFPKLEETSKSSKFSSIGSRVKVKKKTLKYSVKVFKCYRLFSKEIKNVFS